MVERLIKEAEDQLEVDTEMAQKSLLRACYFADQMWQAVQKHQREYVQDEYVGNWEDVVLFRPDPRTGQDVERSIFLRSTPTLTSETLPVIWASEIHSNQYKMYRQVVALHKKAPDYPHIQQLAKDVTNSMKQYYRFTRIDPRTL